MRPVLGRAGRAGALGRLPPVYFGREDNDGIGRADRAAGSDRRGEGKRDNEF